MSVLRHAAWAGPVVLAALAAALLTAVIVARHPSGPPTAGRGAVASEANATSPTPRVPFGPDASYGTGMTKVVPSPVASLVAQVGNEWRVLQRTVGRLLIRPGGTPSGYLEISMVVFAPDRSARLELITSNEQKSIESTTRGRFQIINFGPLRASNGKQVGIALATVQARNPYPGPRLIISPLQAEYLLPGQAVMRMPALAETGPQGAPGIYIPAGITGRFAMTPGITGRCILTMRAGATAGPVQVTAAVGHELRSVIVGTRETVVSIGPFSHAAGVVSLTVAPRRGRPGSVFIGDLRFVAARPPR
jgi:hypothetical protein